MIALSTGPTPTPERSNSTLEMPHSRRQKTSTSLIIQNATLSLGRSIPLRRGYRQATLSTVLFRRQILAMPLRTTSRLKLKTLVSLRPLRFRI